MSLIKCNKCGKSVSDKIDECIYCGSLIEKTNEQDEKWGNPKSSAVSRFCLITLIISIIAMMFLIFISVIFQ